MKRSILGLLCLAVLVTAPACKKKEIKSETTVKRTHKRVLDNNNGNGYKKSGGKKHKKEKKTTTYQRKSNGHGSTSKQKRTVTRETNQPGSYEITTETTQR